jgi:hypothetical protein
LALRNERLFFGGKGSGFGTQIQSGKGSLAALARRKTAEKIRAGPNRIKQRCTRKINAKKEAPGHCQASLSGFRHEPHEVAEGRRGEAVAE